MEQKNSIICFEYGLMGQELWDKCEQGDLMLSLILETQKPFKNEIGLQKLIGTKVKCARLVQHLLKDKRSLDALDLAESFSKGEATVYYLRKAKAMAKAASEAKGYYLFDNDKTAASIAVSREKEGAAYAAAMAAAAAAEVKAEVVVWAAMAAAANAKWAVWQARIGAAWVPWVGAKDAENAGEKERNKIYRQCADIVREYYPNFE